MPWAEHRMRSDVDLYSERVLSINVVPCATTVEDDTAEYLQLKCPLVVNWVLIVLFIIIFEKNFL